MNPAIGSALISTGGNLLGAMMGDKGMRPEHQMLEQYKMQKEFAMHGLQWRADDARRAGLHPMAALGTSPTQFSPIGLFDGGGRNRMGDAFAQSGQALARAYESQLTPHQRAVNDAQLRVMQAQAANDEAQALYWASEAARSRQPGVGAPAGVGGAETSPVHISKIEAHPLTYDHIKPKADEQISVRSGDRSLTSGTHAGMREYRMFSGPKGETNMVLPYSEEGPAEALQSTPFWMLPRLIKENNKRYGGKWLYEFLGVLPPGTVNAERERRKHRYTRAEEIHELKRMQNPWYRSFWSR